jgi:hypothetical protein
MATNTALKKTSAGTDESAAAATDTTEDRPAARRAPAVVGPAPGEGEETVTVTLSHHLRINGADYTPGDKILVSADYARRLRAQGFTART